MGQSTNMPWINLRHNDCRLTQEISSSLPANDNFWGSKRSKILVSFCRRKFKLSIETLNGWIGPIFNSQGAIKWYLCLTTFSPYCIRYFFCSLIAKEAPLSLLPSSPHISYCEISIFEIYNWQSYFSSWQSLLLLSFFFIPVMEHSRAISTLAKPIYDL